MQTSKVQYQKEYMLFPIWLDVGKLYKDKKAYKIYEWFLKKAFTANTSYRYRDKSVILRKHQCCFTYRYLAKELKIHVSALRKAILRLKTSGLILTFGHKFFSIVEIKMKASQDTPAISSKYTETLNKNESDFNEYSNLGHTDYERDINIKGKTNFKNETKRNFEEICKNYPRPNQNCEFFLNIYYKTITQYGIDYVHKGIQNFRLYLAKKDIKPEFVWSIIRILNNIQFWHDKDITWKKEKSKSEQPKPKSYPSYSQTEFIFERPLTDEERERKLEAFRKAKQQCAFFN